MAKSKCFTLVNKLVHHKIMSLNCILINSYHVYVVKMHKTIFKRLHWYQLLQAELDHHLMVNKDDDDNFLIYTDIDDLDTHLDQAFNGFRKQTADPLWMLRWPFVIFASLI